MARLGELPFGRYYGGVDTTPLFVMLAGAYAERTGDLASSRGCGRRCWRPWAGSRARGFQRRRASSATPAAPRPGWRTRAGRTATIRSSTPTAATPHGPIALIEVQGYVYAALRAMAELAWRRGEPRRRRAGGAAPKALRDAVERLLDGGVGFYALALDGEGEPCRVRASNAGHLLFTGLPRPSARAGHEQLLSRGVRLGLGHSDACHGDAALQSHVLSQWLGLAARHRAVRGRAWHATASATACCSC